MVVCADGSAAAYVTAKDRVEGATTTVTLDPNGPFPFRQQARLDATAGPFQCLSDAGAFLTRVERRHFYIALLQDPDPRRRPAGADALARAGPRWRRDLRRAPHRLAGRGHRHRGRRGDRARHRATPDRLRHQPPQRRARRPATALEAAGPDSDDNWVYGDDPGTPQESPPFTTGVWAGAGAPDPLRPPELGNDPTCLPGDLESPTTCGYGGMRRYLGHAGNIRTIRFALVARSPRELPELDHGDRPAAHPVRAGDHPREPDRRRAHAHAGTAARSCAARPACGTCSSASTSRRPSTPPGMLNVAGG